MVSYHPEAQLIDNALALLPQVDEVLVVDNGSGPDSQAVLEKLASSPKITLIRNAHNLGIAAALNKGAHYALERGYCWLATFDQDSWAPPGFVDELVAAHKSCPYRETVAIVAPRYRDKNLGSGFVRSCARRIEHERYSSVVVTMTSGNLVRTEVFKQVGFFDEPLFIDYVDHEFCMRVRKRGWKIIEASQAILDHRCGASSVRRVGRLTILSTNHSALRRYYISRNRIILFKRYLRDDTWWVLDDMFNCLVREPLRILFFERDRAAKMRAMIKGVRDGLLNRLGRAPERI